MAKSKKNNKKQQRKKRSNTNKYTELQDDMNIEQQQQQQSKKTHPYGTRRKKISSHHEDVNDFQFRQSVEEGDSRTIIEIESDGNCMFRSISDQLYQDNGHEHYEQIRQDICDYIIQNQDEFAVFLFLEDEDEDAIHIDEYCQAMREDGAWGGNVELVAAARLYRRNIRVFSAIAAFTIQHDSKTSSGPEMMLSYHDNDHYNSVRDNKAPFVRFTQQQQQQHDDDYEAQMDTTTTTTTTSNETMNDNNHTEAAVETKPTKIIPKKLKANELCHCGSGLRYKKCCKEADKRRERLRKHKEKNGIVVNEESLSNVEDESVSNGKMKVLSI